jgi:hypothetical protein
MPAGAVQIPAPSATASGRSVRHSHVDGRTLPARRVKALIASFAEALGGPAGLSAVQTLRVRRAAELTVTAERMRAVALRDEPIDPLALVRIENTTARAVAALGLPADKEAAAKLARIDEAPAAAVQQKTIVTLNIPLPPGVAHARTPGDAARILRNTRFGAGEGERENTALMHKPQLKRL